MLWVVLGSKGVQMVYKSVERGRTYVGHRGENHKWNGSVDRSCCWSSALQLIGKNEMNGQDLIWSCSSNFEEELCWHCQHTVHQWSQSIIWISIISIQYKDNLLTKIHLWKSECDAWSVYLQCIDHFNLVLFLHSLNTVVKQGVYVVLDLLNLISI